MYDCVALGNLSEEHIAKIVAVKVEAGGIHGDEGWQGCVAPVTVGVI